MIILAPTVHHTGSYFLVKHLLKDFTELPLKTPVTDGLDNDYVIFDHLWPHKMKLWLPLLETYPAIIPLRNYARVRSSWERRGKSYNELQEQWLLLSEIIQRFNPFLLQLDTPMKHDQLATINEQLGLSLDPQGWPVINSKREQPDEHQVTTEH